MRLFMARLGIIILGCMLVLAIGGCSPATVEVDTSTSEPNEDQVQEEIPPISLVDLAGPELGTTMQWVDGSLLVYVPPGEFIMGDGGDDSPIHTVNLSDFWIYRTEVTNAMYLRCMATGECSNPAVDPALPEDINVPELADKPVVGVNWEQAEAYCRFVDGHLPTEAQWEKTARGPDGNIYPWGNGEPNCDLLNFNNCTGKMSDVLDYPSGQSYFEVMDMAGNVFEWVADYYDPNYYGNEPAEDPLGPETGQARSVRGSTFRSGTDQIPSALRFFQTPTEYRTDLGFRCVVESPAFYAPFCELPAFRDPRIPPPETCPPPGVEIQSTYCRKETGYLTFDVTGNLDTISFNGLTCDDAGNNRYVCYGPSDATGSVTVCSDCEENEAQLQPAGGGAAGCVNVMCPLGFNLNTETCQCESAILSVLVLEEATGEDSDNSPSGDGPEQLAEPELTLFGPIIGFLCPPGMYYDRLHGGCIPLRTLDPDNKPGDDCYPRRLSRAPLPEECNTCPPGYVFNPELDCCELLERASPACNGYIDEFGGCRPFELNQGACTTVPLQLPNCELPPPAGCSGCGCYNNRADCGNHNCYWDEKAQVCRTP